jgi:hypothetical protein
VFGAAIIYKWIWASILLVEIYLEYTKTETSW